MELAGSVQADSREIIHDGGELNLEMVRAGHGLWNDPQPVAPRDW